MVYTGISEIQDDIQFSETFGHRIIKQTQDIGWMLF